MSDLVVELTEMEELTYAKKEAFNTLRTNLSFCGEDVKVIIFTSCTPDEGKSSTVMELARSVAEDGRKVLLIDADLRKSVLVGRYHARRTDKVGEIKGLTHFLSGKVKMDEVVVHTSINNLDMVFAGRTTPNPTELLGNYHFDEVIAFGRENYDLVLVDSPPLGSVIDSAVMAPKADGAVIVVEANKCSYRFVQEIKKQLETAGVRILGVVLNKVKMEKSGYYKYKGYYRGYYSGYYQKYYGDKESLQREEKKG